MSERSKLNQFELSHVNLVAVFKWFGLPMTRVLKIQIHPILLTMISSVAKMKIAYMFLISPILAYHYVGEVNIKSD